MEDVKMAIVTVYIIAMCSTQCNAISMGEKKTYLLSHRYLSNSAKMLWKSYHTNKKMWPPHLGNEIHVIQTLGVPASGAIRTMI